MHLKKSLLVLLILSIIVQTLSFNAIAQNGNITYPQDHILLYGEYITGLGGALDKTGFDFDEWITHKTGRNAPTYVPYRNGDAQAYFIYQVPKDGTASYIELKITVDINYIDKIIADNALLNNLYCSEDNITYTSYTDAEIVEGVHSTDDVSTYINYTIKALLPQNTKYIKFDASEFAEMTFFVTNIKLYGERIDTFDYTKVESLYKTHEPYFDLAVAVEPNDLYNYNELILSQYSEITVENQAKPNVIHSNKDWYYFEGTDNIVNFALEHGKRVRIHGLVYEKSMPGWFFVDDEGNEASAELVWQRLEDHVRTIVRRYKGKVYAYDVVNENFGHEGWDTRKLSEVLGTDEYTREVFHWAHEEDPDAILILNDNYYNIEKKRNNIYQYVKGLVQDGVPIHGIGFQHHHFMDIDIADVEETLELFSTIPDFKLFVTELDLRSANLEDYSTRYPEFMSDEILELAAKKYASLFDVYRKYADRIETVGFWNVCDKTNWVNAGKKNYYGVLPFDFNGEPNPAFYSILDIEGSLPRWRESDRLPVVKNNNFTINSADNTLYVTGTFTGEVTAKLYSNFGEKQLLNTANVNADGIYNITFSLDAEYNGTTSPDYILEVYEGDTLKSDKFTYNTKADEHFTVTDALDDTSKLYSYKNLVFLKDAASHNGDESGLIPQWFWGGEGANIGDAEVVYKIPDGFAFDTVKIDMFTPESINKTFDIYTSKDGAEYYLTDNKWSKTVSTDSGNIGYSFNLQVADADAKYLKIFMGNDKGQYLANVDIKTKNIDLAKLDNAIAALQAANIQIIEQNGVFSVETKNNVNVQAYNIAVLLAAYNGDELVSCAVSDINNINNLTIDAPHGTTAKLFVVGYTPHQSHYVRQGKLSSKCNINFFRRFPTKTFSRSIVD